MTEKSNIVSLFSSQRKQVTADKPAQEIPLTHEIQFIGLAVAYYVHMGRMKEARDLVSFLCSSPLKPWMTLPQPLAELVETADYGDAMFPPG